MTTGSLFSRWWKAVQPPPKAQSRDPRIQIRKRKQRKVIRFVAGGLLLLAAGAFTLDYVVSAPERSRAALALADAKMAPGGYEAAIPHFNRAIEITPQLADAYLGRGIAERNLGRLDSAIADFEKTLDLDETLTAAHDELGEIYAARGETRRALEQFSNSIQAKPTANGYYQRGQLYEKLGEHEKAVDDFNLAIGELSESPYIYFARATARGNLGDSEGARADRSKGVALATETGQAH